MDSLGHDDREAPLDRVVGAPLYKTRTPVAPIANLLAEAPYIKLLAPDLRDSLWLYIELSCKFETPLWKRRRRFIHYELEMPPGRDAVDISIEL
jgi:hypothetical protein